MTTHHPCNYVSQALGMLQTELKFSTVLSFTWILFCHWKQSALYSLCSKHDCSIQCIEIDSRFRNDAKRPNNRLFKPFCLFFFKGISWTNQWYSLTIGELFRMRDCAPRNLSLSLPRGRRTWELTCGLTVAIANLEHG